MPKSLAEALSGHEDGEHDGEDGEPDYKEHAASAMEAFIQAVHAKDAHAALEAFETVSELCGHDEPDGDEAAPHALMIVGHHDGG